MIFKKKSYQQQKKDRIDGLRDKFNRETKWRRWFAWYPVILGDYLDDTDSAVAWLRWVERRRSAKSLEVFYPALDRWIYRLPEGGRCGSEQG